MGMRAVSATVAIGLGFALAGCGGDPGVATPTAVITARPDALCLGDDYQTIVELDASNSAPGLTLLPATAPLEGFALVYAWELTGAAHRIEGQDPKGITLRVSTAGDRPLHVALTVTNEEGGQATSLRSLPVTLPPALKPCVAGSCPAGERCLPLDGEDRCVLALDCEILADCPPCYRCDKLQGACVPTAVAP